MKSVKTLLCSGAFALGAFLFSGVAGHAQEQPRYARDYCVKVRDGKWQQYSAFLRDVSTKLAKVRVDDGTMARYVVAEAVAPVGRSARCDYHIIITYNGFPPDSLGAERTAADMKKAGITISRDEMLAKRDELSYLVGMDIWRWREWVGPAMKGGYARINYDKVNGPMGDWLAMESNGWKQLAEAAAKEHGTAWRVATLAMPGGADRPYNAMTVDLFPSWEAMGKGIPARDIWNKVHPNSDISAHLNRLSEMRTRPRVDIVKLVEVIGK